MRSFSLFLCVFVFHFLPTFSLSPLSLSLISLFLFTRIIIIFFDSIKKTIPTTHKKRETTTTINNGIIIIVRRNSDDVRVPWKN